MRNLEDKLEKKLSEPSKIKKWLRNLFLGLASLIGIFGCDFKSINEIAFCADKDIYAITKNGGDPKILRTRQKLIRGICLDALVLLAVREIKPDTKHKVFK